MAWLAEINLAAHKNQVGGVYQVMKCIYCHQGALMTGEDYRTPKRWRAFEGTARTPS
jgi:hypothetical protein